LSLPKYYLLVCTIMVACRKNGGYQTSGFWFWFWQCGYICQKTRLPSGGFEMTMMARCFMFLLRPVEISSNPVTNHGAPGFTKLDGFWHVFDAFFCHAQAIPAIGWLDDWDWVQRTLRSLGSPGQCDLRQRRRLSVPSLRAKVAETWLGHGSRLRGARSITELRSLLETFTWIVVGGLSLFFRWSFFELIHFYYIIPSFSRGMTMNPLYQSPSGWWFGTFFIFHFISGIILPIDVHIFQRGWNHQPAQVAAEFGL
jgi:hypothetical protein